MYILVNAKELMHRFRKGANLSIKQSKFYT